MYHAALFQDNLAMSSDQSDSEPDIAEPQSSESDSDTATDDVFDSTSDTYMSKSGNIEWRKEPSRSIRGRVSERNVVNFTPGPAPHIKVATIRQSFELFIFSSMIEDVVISTNKEAAICLQDPNCPVYIHREWVETCVEEMYAYIGLLIYAGVSKSNDMDVHDLWSEKRGPAIFRATMGRERFQLLTRFLRFDDRATRHTRRENDKLAALRQVWDAFIVRCRDYFIPGYNLTVDEQIVPFRGRAPFKVYMKSKPDRYGIKIWAIVDNDNSYLCNAQVYLGKLPGERREIGQAERVVCDLVEPFRQSGRNITVDQHFSSISLANALKERRLTLLGTINKQRREIPPAFLPDRHRNVGSSMFAFHESVVLVSYVPRPNRAVLLISTLHSQPELNADGKPVIIDDYNGNKGGVDTNDQMSHGYTARRKTRRWPVVLFHHILDMAAINSLVIWKHQHPTWQNSFHGKHRKEFLFCLAEELVMPWIHQRETNFPHGLHSHVRTAMIQMGVKTPTPAVDSSSTVAKRRSCHLCVGERRIQQRCSKCQQHVCTQHSSIICNNCL